MTVLFVSASGGLGGAERALVECVAALRERRADWRLHVLGLEAGPLGEELARLGVSYDVVDLPSRFARLGESGHSALATATRLATSAPALVGYRARLRAAIESRSPDVVHSNGFKSHVLTAWAVVPPRRLVWHVHDFVGHRKVSSWLLLRHARRVTVIVANSHAVAADVRHIVGARARVEVIYNGVDTSRFAPEGEVADLDAMAGLPPAPSGTTRVGLVATYARWKGHDVFLDAVARLADRRVRAYVVGGPQYQTAGSQRTREELEHVASRLGLAGRVGFVAFQRDTAPVYRALDVVAHTSTEPEPFGLSIVEAMACGRPVAISDAGGAAEIAQACAGAPSFPPGDAIALSGVLARFTADASLRAEVGRAGRDTAVRCFSRDRMAASLSALYQGLHEPRALAPVRS